METLRTAFIYPGYPPEESLGGGISTYAQEATEGLTRNNHDVTVFSRTESMSEGLDPNQIIKVFRLPSEAQETEEDVELAFRNKGAQLYGERVRDAIIKFEQDEGEFDIIEAGDWGAEAIALLPEYKHKL